MKETYEHNEFTVTLKTAFDEKNADESRVKIDILIVRTETGEDVFHELRYLARINGAVTLEDGIRYGKEITKGVIERGAFA